MPIRVTIWNEFRHEKKKEAVAKIYPKGMHEAIASYLREASDLSIKTATLDEPEHGLTQAIVDQSDVMVWWGHVAHGEVQDAIVDRVHKRVISGMGLVVLHSGHFSKIFKKLMGTSPPRPSDREGHQRPFHPPARGNVRRILRHPRA